MDTKIDWLKYKRFFAFGCSFTSYVWPTWADIVSKEMPNAEYFNFGVSGSGNLLISLRIAEANNRFKFTDTDLIMIMFTTYTREDRWVDNKWITPGNIYNNDIYPKDWVKKFADERGYLIRDAALIDMSMKYLDHLPCNKYCMLSVPFIERSDHCELNGKTHKDILDTYLATFDRLPPSMFDLEIRESTQLDYAGFKDGHPSTIRYYNYLKKLGINLGEKSKRFSEESSDLLKTITNKKIIPLYFAEQKKNIERFAKLMF